MDTPKTGDRGIDQIASCLTMPDLRWTWTLILLTHCLRPRGHPENVDNIVLDTLILNPSRRNELPADHGGPAQT